MRLSERVSFSGGGLQRRAERRDRANALLNESDARVLALWRGRPLVTGPQAEPTLLLLPAAHPFLAVASDPPVYLGAADGANLFAVDLSEWEAANQAALDVGPGLSGEDQPVEGFDDLPADTRFADLRGLIAVLGALDAEIAATAKGILEWHRTHPYCAACGKKSKSAEGGWRRDCPACSSSHFPRTDPVVIMLVTRGNALLIGRSPGWPEGFYSLLAGFMEPGETVAQAVRREVLEETNVSTGTVRMLTSQPWPFPASLMIGCTATAISHEITPDPNEIADALWISREDLLQVFAGRHPDIRTPRSGAIAHFLMKMWLADTLD